jgi:DNA primase
LDYSATAVCGHDISEEQVKILAGLNLKEIVIAFDKDVSQNELRAQCEKFYGIRNVSYIYDTDNLLQDKDAPIDQGNEVYQYLFKNRIHYDSNEHDEYLKYLHEQKIKRSVSSAQD